MPREIITLQVGQCGNQSNSKRERELLMVGSRIVTKHHFLLFVVILEKLAWNSGNNSAPSMGSTKKACWKNSLPAMMTGKMCFSIKLMMSITFQEHV